MFRFYEFYASAALSESPIQNNECVLDRDRSKKKPTPLLCYPSTTTTSHHLDVLAFKAALILLQITLDDDAANLAKTHANPHTKLRGA